MPNKRHQSIRSNDISQIYPELSAPRMVSINDFGLEALFSISGPFNIVN